MFLLLNRKFRAAPLYHLVRPYDNHHFYCTKEADANTSVSAWGFKLDVSPGLFAKNALDCNCRATFQSPTRLYRIPTADNPIDEHFYTLNDDEIWNYINTRKYRWEGFDRFFCSTTAGYCGATVPLHRFLKNGKHYFSTTLEGQVGATYEGVTCYLWPSA